MVGTDVITFEVPVFDGYFQRTVVRVRINPRVSGVHVVVEGARFVDARHPIAAVPGDALIVRSSGNGVDTSAHLLRDGRPWWGHESFPWDIRLKAPVVRAIAFNPSPYAPKDQARTIEVHCGLDETRSSLGEQEPVLLGSMPLANEAARVAP